MGRRAQAPVNPTLELSNLPAKPRLDRQNRRSASHWLPRTMTHTERPLDLDAPVPDWLRKLDLTPDTLSYHLSHPEPSADAYVRAQHLALGGHVLQKRRVYLDQKYWIYCRDAARGTPKQAEHKRLYEILQEAVTSGQLLCPASHLVLEETLKQTDSATRASTAQVVQELSGGIAVQPFPVLFQAEILHFLVTTRPWDVDAYPVEQLAWTHVGNVFGHLSPVCSAFDPDTLRAIQKAWFDLMANVTFPTLAESLAPMPDELLHTPSEFYEWQNAQCEAHRGDYRSFKQAFLIELAGGLDVAKEELREAQLYLYERHTGQKGDRVAQDEVDDGVRKLSNLIYHAFRLDKIKKQFAGLRIMAGIHAAARHKAQKYQRGDRHDHLHARVALPYCDLFLTEKSLGHLVTTKPLEYDALYGCRVVWEPNEAVAAVKDLLNGGQQPTKRSSTTTSPADG